MNKARIKALSMMVCALCKVQRVTYTKLASACDSDALPGSSLRRIQRLIAECVLDTDLIARFILKLIPVKGPYNLSMDRTNWKFSDTNINILTLGVIYDGMAFPIVYTMMDKQGNSNTSERIGLVDRFIRLAGEDSVAHLMADREFVGNEWLGYLNSRGIHYHIRIRENFHVVRHGREFKAYWLFNDLKLGESKHLEGIYYVNGQACYLSGSKIKDKDGKPVLHHHDCICLVLPCRNLYSRKHQTYKGLEAWAKGREPVQVRTGLHLTVPDQPHRPL